MNMVNQLNGLTCPDSTCNCKSSNDSVSDSIVLKLRIANSMDTDFIETELPRKHLTYSNLVCVICTEFELNPLQISRLRKLPNTRIRNDNDVKRLNEYQEIDVVLNAPIVNRTLNASNVYPSITSKDQTVLY